MREGGGKTLGGGYFGAGIEALAAGIAAIGADSDKIQDDALVQAVAAGTVKAFGSAAGTERDVYVFGSLAHSSLSPTSGIRFRHVEPPTAHNDLGAGPRSPRGF